MQFVTKQDRLCKLHRVGRELAAFFHTFSFDLIELLEAFALEFRIQHVSSWHPGLKDLSVHKGVVYSLEAEKLYKNDRDLYIGDYTGSQIRGLHCGQSNRVWYYTNNVISLLTDYETENEGWRNQAFIRVWMQSRNTDALS